MIKFESFLTPSIQSTTGIGVGTASTSVSIGRLRLKEKDDDNEIEGALSDIRYGADYYKSIGDVKALQLYNYASKVYEEKAQCIDYDVVECLKEAAACAVLCCGKHSTPACTALRILGDKCEEGGELTCENGQFLRRLTHVCSFKATLIRLLPRTRKPWP